MTGMTTTHEWAKEHLLEAIEESANTLERYAKDLRRTAKEIGTSPELTFLTPFDRAMIIVKDLAGNLPANLKIEHIARYAGLLAETKEEQ